MNIEINNKTKSKVDLFLIKKVTESFLKLYNKKDYGVSIAFVGDKKIRELNKNYRGVDRVTDVLSFAGEEKFLGEIIIDYSQVRRQAKRFNNKVREELIFILVHGLLHLAGYDDRTEGERKKMEKLVEKFISKLNL